jgi:predicted transcriptional regulator YheO
MNSKFNMENIMQDNIPEYNISGLTLRAVKKLFRFNCTIRTEGTVDGWLCENLDKDAPERFKTCVLIIFIASNEELTMRAVTTMPTSQEMTTQILQEVLEGFKERYIAYSVQERNQCAQPH